MEKETFFKEHPRLLEDLKNANIFNKHTGDNFNAMDPGVRFGIHHEWYETFDLSSKVLKKLVEALESKNASRR